jgi:hypothetical protein
VKAPLTTIAENWESTVSLDPDRALPKLEAMEEETNKEEEEEGSSSESESGTESGSGSLDGTSSTSGSSLESSSSSYEEDHSKVPSVFKSVL